MCRVTGMSIHKIITRVKLFLVQKGIKIAYIIIMFLSVILAYLVGLFVQVFPEKEPLFIEYPPLLPAPSVCESSQALPQSMGVIKGSFVASKNGSKYYPIGCGGVSRINEENKVYFSSEQEALDKGYEKASGC